MYHNGLLRTAGWLAANAGEEGEEGERVGDSFGFGEGGTYSLNSFRRRADDFKQVPRPLLRGWGSGLRA